MDSSEPAFEPFRIKAGEPLGFTTRVEREALLREARWDVSSLPADKVLIDLLTDSGASAPPAAAGSPGLEAFERAVRDLTGLRHALPASQGRAAERALFKIAGGPGKVFLSNALSVSARASIAAAGSEALDVPVPDALDPALAAPFKGDIEPLALEIKLRDLGSRAAMIVMTLTNGALGGQPASLSNLREARDVSRHHRIPLFLDASRCAENAWFIKRRELGHGGRAPAEIARELFSNCDGAWMSARKGGFADGGGFLALNDGAWAARAKEEMNSCERRGLGPLAAGLVEAFDERGLSHRSASIERFAQRLRAAGVPLVEPAGGHAVCLDAGRMLRHLPAAARPARALAEEIYLEGGVRAAADSSSGREWVRLSIPRRAYTESHLAHAAAVVAAVAARAGALRGRLEPELAA
jgi:tyrosine phenol-lyase